MVTKLTNGSRFARSLPAILVNPPLWALSTELHRFILTQRQIHISHAVISLIFLSIFITVFSDNVSLYILEH